MYTYKSELRIKKYFLMTAVDKYTLLDILTNNYCHIVLRIKNK